MPKPLVLDWAFRTHGADWGPAYKRRARQTERDRLIPGTMSRGCDDHRREVGRRDPKAAYSHGFHLVPASLSEIPSTLLNFPGRCHGLKAKALGEFQDKRLDVLQNRVPETAARWQTKTGRGPSCVVVKQRWMILSRWCLQLRSEVMSVGVTLGGVADPTLRNRETESGINGSGMSGGMGIGRQPCGITAGAGCRPQSWWVGCRHAKASALRFLGGPQHLINRQNEDQRPSFLD